jgi:hypothetical protein
MTLAYSSDVVPERWLAFELSVLRRLKFSSVAIPFAAETDLAAHLKRWGARVVTSDVARWAWIESLARVENSGEQLTAQEVEVVLEDAYVPGHRLRNAALRRWFTETDAWWFDNVRANADRLDSPIKRALALTIGMAVGDYALSFDEATRELRQPLSRVYRRLWEIQPPPFNNHQNNVSANQPAREFIAEQHTDLLFLRLPQARRERAAGSPRWAWREEWVRGENNFWAEMEKSQAGRLGAPVGTKQQYLRLVQELLEAALHLPAWAIAHVENGFVATDELVETVRRVRKVGNIYTKDFSELTGARASIITTI